MSPRYPSKDPRIIRAALAYAETHTMNATATHFGVQHHTIKRWHEYRDAHGPTWPTDQDIADWDAKAPERAVSQKWKRRYVHRLHRNGGQPLLQPAHGTIRRLQALCALGWTHRQIGARLGVTPSRVSHIIRLTQDAVLIDTARRVADLYDQISMVVPAGRDASYARREAARKGWAPPLSWDDDTIDDPNAEPVGLPGSGDDPAGYDESRIERRIAGDRSVKLHKGETAEVVRRLVADGWSLNAIRRHTGVKPERYITRTTVERAA